MAYGTRQIQGRSIALDLFYSMKKNNFAKLESKILATTSGGSSICGDSREIPTSSLVSLASGDFGK